MNWNGFCEAFIALFVAVDAIGLIPVYMGLTHNLDKQHRRNILLQSLITASLVALIFILVGKAIFSVLGITVGDFQIAGGLVLLVLAIMDLLWAQRGDESQVSSETAGIVPIGVPLIVGPAVLTSVIIQVDVHGLGIALSAMFLNLFLLALIFWRSEWLDKVLGKSGAKAISKIISLLLAAIAVMMIRRGIMALISMN